jgi:hypothetical protein
MAWKGYFTYDGIEVMNASRVEAYMETICAPWFKPIYESETLRRALGDQPYVSPLVDTAPWVDPDSPESYGFYGIYPIDVTGIEDGTGQTQITESTRDGGSASRTRYGSREVVFSAILIANSEQGAEYGLRWLKRVLRGDPCLPSDNCHGRELRYLNADITPIPETPQPAVLDGSGNEVIIDGGKPNGAGVVASVDGGGPGDVASQISPPFPLPFLSPAQPSLQENLEGLTRRLRKVSVTGPPSITGQRETTTHHHLWRVQWTLTAVDPYQYTLPRPVFANYGDPSSDEFIDGVQYFPLDTESTIATTDVACPTPIWSPIYDPNCPPLDAPPTAPDVASSCWVSPTSWRRWWITTPRDQVPRWDVVSPVLDIYARDEDLRGLRVRFFPDEGETPSDTLRTCDWAFDFVVTYLPEGFRMTIDAAAQTITATDVDGISRGAGSLVMGSDGKPFTWPELSCDRSYVVAFDLDTAIVTPSKPITSLSLVTKVPA